MQSHRRAVETRRLYRFEDVFTRTLPVDVRRDRRIAELRDIAAGVWSGEGRSTATCPTVTCGAGVPQNGAWFSYCEGDRIVLSRAQRTVGVLLHELTHALGHDTHGKDFVNRYVHLLCAYGGCEEGHLRLGLSLFKVNG